MTTAVTFFICFLTRWLFYSALAKTVLHPAKTSNALFPEIVDYKTTYIKQALLLRIILDRVATLTHLHCLNNQKVTSPVASPVISRECGIQQASFRHHNQLMLFF